MNGDQATAKILKKEGVEWIAAFPAQSLIDACAREGIRPILSRQERAGVNMADGFSRIKNGQDHRRVHHADGPGSENAFGGVAQAFADSVPILCLPGGQPFDRMDVHPNFEAVKNYAGITKWMALVNSVERIPELMGMAFSQLKHGRLGPVLLELPRDVMVQEIPDGLWNPTSPSSRSSRARARRTSATSCRRCCGVRAGRHAGQGVMYAEATDELVEFAELTNVPVMTTLAGKSAFPEDHPLSLGTGASSGTLMCQRFLEKADFVLGVGTSFTISNFNAPMPRGVTLAHSTNCAEDVNKDYRADYGAVGDAKVVLRQMIEEAKSQLGEHGRGDVHGVRDGIAAVRAEWMAEWTPSLQSDEVPISPYRVFTELMKAVDARETIITHDSGYPREQIVPFWPAVTPRNYIGWGEIHAAGLRLGLGARREDGGARKAGHQHNGRRRLRHGGAGHRDRLALGNPHPHGGAEQRRDDALLRPHAIRHRALGEQRAGRRVRGGGARAGRVWREGERPVRDSARHRTRPSRQPRGQARPAGDED